MKKILFYLLTFLSIYSFAQITPSVPSPKNQNGKVLGSNGSKYIWTTVGAVPSGALFAVNASTLSNLSAFTVSVTNSSSVTLSGGKIRMTRTDANLGFNDFFTYNSFGDIDSKYWSFVCDFEVKRLDATSYGFGFGLKADAVNNTTDYVRGRIETTTAGTKGTLTLDVDGASQGSGSTKLTFALNDRIRMQIQRNNEIFTLSVQNVTSVNTVAPVCSLTVIMNRGTSTGWSPTMLRPYFFNLGGTFDLDEFTFSTQLTSNSKIFIGDSNTHGFFTANSSKPYPELIKYVTNTQCDNFGSTSTTTADWLNGINEVIQRQPKIVYFMLGRNDVATSVTQSVTLNNFAALTGSLTAANIPYKIISILPSGSSLNAAITSLNAALQAAYPSNYIDIQSYLNDGSGNIKPAFGSGDGTHFNELGHIEIAKRLMNADPTLIN